jgi:hypothetical protein
MAQRKRKKRAGPVTGIAAAVADYRRRRLAHRFQELTEETKRRSAGARQRRRMLAALAKAAGTDLETLQSLHRKDWEMMLRRAERQERSARALLAREQSLRRRMLGTINRHRARFEYRGGNPHTSICLWKASEAPNLTVNPQTFNDGIVRLLSQIQTLAVVPGQNSVIFTVEVDASRPHDIHLSPAAAVDIFSTQVFETEAPHAGSLTVAASYVPQGTALLVARGDCMLPGSAGVEVDLHLQVSILPAAGGRIDLPDVSQKIVDEEALADCDGRLRSIPVGTSNGVAFQVTTPTSIQVHAGDGIRITTNIEIYMGAGSGGVARATFSPRPMGLNVPMVLVKIDS